MRVVHRARRISRFCFLVLVCGLTQAAISNAALTPAEQRRLLDDALDHFYNLEYDYAISSFETLRDGEPSNPRWHNHLAYSYLYKQLLLAGALEGDLFVGSSRVDLQACKLEYSIVSPK